MKYRSQTAYERMMQRVKIPKDKTKCWLWCGPVNNAGFGMIRGDGGQPKMTTVHRIAAKHIGLNIDDTEVQHTCLTKHCVNPDHLVLGNALQRTHRIIKKHGKNFMKPKNPHKTCEYCGITDHVVWFSRKHKSCYTGMLDKYTEYMRNKYK
jgi:hypothetical protein